MRNKKFITLFDNITQKKYGILLCISLSYLLIEVLIGSKIFIWTDECFTLITSRQSIKETIMRSIIFEGQPPVYFTLLNLWRSLNESVFFARLFSILVATTSISVFYLYIKKRQTSLNKNLITGLFAFNPVMIWAGLEIRVFALVILLSALLILLFEEVYVDSYHNLKKRILFIFISLVAVHTHYYFSFFLLANFFYLLLFHRHGIYTYLLDMLLPALSLTIYLPFLNSQIQMHDIGSFLNININGISFLKDIVKNYLFPLPSFVDGETSRYYLIIPAVIILFFLKYNFKFFKQFLKQQYLICLLVFMLGIYILLYFILGKDMVLFRHTLFIYIPILTLFITALGFFKSKIVRLIFILILFVTYFLNIYSKFPDFGKDDELVDIHSVISMNKDSSSPILCYKGEFALIYNLIDNDTNVYSIPHTLNLATTYNYLDWFIKDYEELDTFFMRFNNAENIWLIDSSPSAKKTKYFEHYNITAKYDVLDKFVSDNYSIIYEREYGGKFRLRKLVNTSLP